MARKISECLFVFVNRKPFAHWECRSESKWHWHDWWKSQVKLVQMCLPAFQTFCQSDPSSSPLHRWSTRVSPLPPRFQALSHCLNRSNKIDSSHIWVCQAPSARLEQCSQQIWWWNWCRGTLHSFVPWRRPINQRQRSELSCTGKPGVPCKVNDPGNLPKWKFKTLVAEGMYTWVMSYDSTKQEKIKQVWMQMHQECTCSRNVSKRYHQVAQCYAIKEIQYMLKFPARVQGTTI